MLPVVVLIAATPPALHAQTSEAADALSRTIVGLDTALFDAYNTCDLEKLGRFAADDLEFYHDKDGLSVGRQAFVESTRQNICGKVRRELVPGTVEVYPIGDYGAVEIGVHRFYHPGKDDVEPIGEAKFLILWRHKDGAWTISRVVSYGHGALPK